MTKLTEDRIEQATMQVTDQVEALTTSLLEELAAALDLPTAQVTAQGGSIMGSVASDERSRDELMQAAELSHREHFRKFYLNPLMLAGWVVRT
ncbi:MAG: hypothetical protein IPP83_09840, partial [Flavobacteriales bacterium]|nr:hypothetical protein [Flavobacteriales bacterium]